MKQLFNHYIEQFKGKSIFCFCNVLDREIANYFLKLKELGVIKDIRSSYEYNPLIEPKYEYEIAVVSPTIGEHTGLLLEFLRKQNKKILALVSSSYIMDVPSNFEIIGKGARYSTATNLECEKYDYTELKFELHNIQVIETDNVESLPEEEYSGFMIVPCSCLKKLCKNCFEIITLINDDTVVIKHKSR